MERKCWKQSAKKKTTKITKVKGKKKCNSRRDYKMPIEESNKTEESTP